MSPNRQYRLHINRFQHWFTFVYILLFMYDLQSMYKLLNLIVSTTNGFHCSHRFKNVTTWKRSCAVVRWTKYVSIIFLIEYWDSVGFQFQRCKKFQAYFWNPFTKNLCKQGVQCFFNDVYLIFSIRVTCSTLVLIASHIYLPSLV